MLEILFFPIVLLAALPGTALIPGIAFTLLYLKRRKQISKMSRAAVLGTSFIWLVYGIYETRMYFWMQTVIAPIRVDLLLIVPVLYAVTIIGVLALLKKSRATS